MRTMAMSRRRRRCCWRRYSKKGEKDRMLCMWCMCVCVPFSVKVQWTKLQVERIYHGQSQKSISNVSKVFYSLTHPPSRCAVLLLILGWKCFRFNSMRNLSVNNSHVLVSLPPFFLFFRPFDPFLSPIILISISRSFSLTHALSINLLHCVAATSKRQFEYSIPYMLNIRYMLIRIQYTLLIKFIRNFGGEENSLRTNMKWFWVHREKRLKRISKHVSTAVVAYCLGRFQSTWFWCSDLNLIETFNNSMAQSNHRMVCVRVCSQIENNFVSFGVNRWRKKKSTMVKYQSKYWSAAATSVI